MEHGEVNKYMDSRKLDRECKEAVEGTIRQNFDGMYLKHDIVKPLAEQYGSDRIAFVLSHARYFPECKAPLLMLCYPLKNTHPMIPAGVCWQDMNRELLKNGF